MHKTLRWIAVVAFFAFALASQLAWLHKALFQPFGSEGLDPRAAVDTTALDDDVTLLRRYLPGEGKVGYLSNKKVAQQNVIQLRLAPLILDPTWQRYDRVLVDYPAQGERPLATSPFYRLLSDLPEARSFGQGLRLYERRH